MSGFKSIISDALLGLGLQVTGTVAVRPEDQLSPGLKSLVLLSPADDFWSVFTRSAEFQDGATDPMDRWSLRTISGLADLVEGVALFPFATATAPPAPFFGWAQRSGRAWPSPVHLLTSADMGLNLSYRGAVGLRHDTAIAYPEVGRPCDGCHAPCLSACPAGALTSAGYDVPACKSHLAEHPEGPCKRAGCLVRRACPVSTAQAAAHARFHMDAFLA